MDQQLTTKSTASSAIPTRTTRTFKHSIRAALMLATREWTRFFRQRGRVGAALGQPILFWILFGTGMHTAFQSGEQSFMTFYLPGTVTLILMFTAIFATISIIEDRKEGFLQSVLVAPVGRWTIAAGKILGGGLIAWVQACVFVVIALLVGSLAFNGALLASAGLMLLAAFALTALGVIFAWPMDSTQAFHAIMNLVLMPLWLLSGAFFPVPNPGSDSPIGQWIMHWIMRANPLSYTVSGLRHLQTTGSVVENSQHWTADLTTSWIVTVFFFLTTTTLAWLIVLRPAKGDLK